MGYHLYSLVWTVLKPFYGLCYPRRVSGLEKLPEEGAFILCINHISGHDPLNIATCLPRKRRLTFLAKKELFEIPVVGTLMNGMGGIPVDRGNADIGAVRASLAALKSGLPVGIFPQGTRSRDNTPTPMLNGASMIALRGGVPVIPAYISGPYKLFHKMDVRFGDPIDLSSFGRRVDADTLNAVTERIAAAIWSLKDA